MCIICVELDKKTLLPWEAAKNLLEYSEIIDEEHFEEVMEKIINWINENKLSVAFIGGALVIGSQWGTCTLQPTGGDDAIQEIQPEAEEVSEDN